MRKKLASMYTKAGLVDSGIAEMDNPASFRSYFSHPGTMVPTYGAGRDHREHRVEISHFF